MDTEDPEQPDFGGIEESQLVAEAKKEDEAAKKKVTFEADKRFAEQARAYALAAAQTQAKILEEK